VSVASGADSEPPRAPRAPRDRRAEASRLADVRGELQRLGYLSHRLERFLLSDALVPRGPWRGLLRLATKVGAAAGSLIAAVNVVALASANRVADRALDLAALSAHVAVPVFAGTAAGFLAVVVLFRALLRPRSWRSRRRWRSSWRTVCSPSESGSPTPCPTNGSCRAAGWRSR
jgi:hypothetical protein